MKRLLRHGLGLAALGLTFGLGAAWGHARGVRDVNHKHFLAEQAELLDWLKVDPALRDVRVVEQPDGRAGLAGHVETELDRYKLTAARNPAVGMRRALEVRDQVPALREAP